MRVAVVDMEERIDEGRRLATNGRQVYLERAGRMCDGIPRGDQLDTWIANEKASGWKAARQSDYSNGNQPEEYRPTAYVIDVSPRAQNASR